MVSLLETDLYQIRIAERNWIQNYNKIEVHELFFRKAPFNGAYALAVGINEALKFLNASLSKKECKWLIKQNFSKEFVDYLYNACQNKSLFGKIKVYTVKEGTVVFPHEPIVKVIGPTIPVQLLETYLMYSIGYPSLIATKASRNVYISKSKKPEVIVTEMGLRRAQTGAGHIGAKAAYIGGVDMTCDAYVGMKYGIPTSGGSMMHSDIMRRENEIDAFRSFYDYVNYKNKVIFLIDTYDLFTGCVNAIKVGKEMLKNGHYLLGVRIDSGNLIEVVPKIRKMLDDAGFTKTKIMLSGDLNEYKISEMVDSNIPFDMLGIGTELITGGDQPALGAAYKLTAVEEEGRFIPKIKISASSAKTTIPGSHQVYRFYSEQGQILKDIIAIDDEFIDEGKPLLNLVYDRESISKDYSYSEKEVITTSRANAQKNLNSLPEEYRTLVPARQFPVVLSTKTKEARDKLTKEFEETSH